MADQKFKGAQRAGLPLLQELLHPGKRGIGK